MKKIVSVLLFSAMLATLLIPALSVSAADARPTSLHYTFDDGVDRFAPPADMYGHTATSVVSVNGDPTATIFPLKKPGGWMHATLPFMFNYEQTYIISYDVAVVDNFGGSTLTDAKLTPIVTTSPNTSEEFGLGSHILSVNFLTGSDVVTAGQWNHTVVRVTIPKSDMPWTPDSFGFMEDPRLAGNVYSTYLLDNLVIMPIEEYEAKYPVGVPARTDDPTLGYDKVVEDFNDSRYPLFRSSDLLEGRISVTLRGDSVMTWNRAKSSADLTKESCIYFPFRFVAGKTYRVGFDMAVDANGAGTKLELIASNAAFGNDGTLQKFAGADSVTVVSLPDTNWVHVDMTLTAAEDAKYFTLALDAASVALESKLYFDNFALTESSAFPTDMPLRTAGIDNVMRESFDQGTGVFHSVFWGTNNILSNATVERDGILENVLNWEAAASGATWNQILASYCFEKEKTYVISFDVMLYGTRSADGSISTEGMKNTQLMIYTLNQNWNNFADGKDNTVHSWVDVKAGEWTHISVAIEVPNVSSRNYLGLREATGNTDNGCFYIDNLTIAKKTAECTDDTHIAGVWVATERADCSKNGEIKLTCAICNADMDTKEIAGGHIPTGEWIVDEETSCAKAGSQHKMCSVCGEVAVTEEIARLAHTPGEWIIDREPACVEDGEKHAMCTACGQEAMRGAIPAVGHTPGKWVVDKEPTVDAVGHRYKSCTACNETIKEENIDPLEPSDTEPVTEAPTAQPAPEEKKGCKGAVGVGSFALLGLIALAGVTLKKREQ